jgi:hypothetical protein
VDIRQLAGRNPFPLLQTRQTELWELADRAPQRQTVQLTAYQADVSEVAGGTLLPPLQTCQAENPENPELVDGVPWIANMQGPELD